MKFLRNPWFQAALMMVVGVGLVLWVFAGQDLRAVWKEMQRADLKVLILAVLLSGIGHWLRALRWKSLMDGPDVFPRTQAAFLGLMMGYLVNFAIPRLGEVTRCALLFRFDRVPMLKSLATVFVERLVDVLMLFVLVLIALFTASAALSEMLERVVYFPLLEVWEERRLILLVVMGLLVIVGFLGLLYLRRWLRNSPEGKFQGAIGQVRQGLRSVFELKAKGTFTMQTAGIWISYWSGPACTLWAMGMLNEDWLGVSFAMFTMGSIARTIPIPAGSVGPYHFLVSQVLIAFGFDPVLSLAAATVNHATQTFFYFIAGSFSALALPFLKEKASDTQGTPEAFQ